MFRRLRIPDDLLADAQIERVTDKQARVKYGIVGSATEDMNGIFYPSFAPETGNRSSGRLRRDNPEKDRDGKPIKKYVAAYGDRRRFYYPPGVEEKYNERSIPVVLVESEKASLALTAWAKRTGRRQLVLAMGGCWGWCTSHQERNEHGVLVKKKTVVFDFAYLVDREVYVLLDANVADNPKVRFAERELNAELKKRNSRVHLCHLPQSEGVNGPDDYIAVAGDEAMAKVFDSAPSTPGAASKVTVWDTAEDMTTFLDGEDKPLSWLIVNVLAKECLTQIYAPRGLGKSVLMLYWVVKLALAGLRVLILDKDNPRSVVRSRLISLGCEGLPNLKILARNRCPYLTDQHAWLAFPYDAYDVVIVDSWNALTPGVSEKDTAASALALQPLQELTARGAAVLLIGNTVRSGAHSRLNGVVEDRADFIFEVRDGTDLKPSGTKPWVDEFRSRAQPTGRRALPGAKGARSSVSRWFRPRLGSVPSWNRGCLRSTSGMSRG